MPLTFQSSIVFACVVDLFYKSEISIPSVFHFFAFDFLVTIIVFIIYKKYIINTRKICNIDQVFFYCKKYFLLLFILSVLQIIIIYYNVNEGESRIIFHNERWYSFIKIIGWIFEPLLCIVAFIYLRFSNYRLAIIALSLIIVKSIISGSKSGFIIIIFTSFLVYRDLFGITKKELKINKLIALLILILAFLNLQNMGVDLNKLQIRVLSFAEDSIMVYPSLQPTEACQDFSIINAVHRGIGRLIGDEDSMQFNALYGISLSNIFYGVNSATGPNSRIGSYTLCSFPGILIIIPIFFGALYLFLLWIVFKKMIFSGGLFMILGFPFFASSISLLILDYNSAMSILSTLILLLTFFFIKNLIPKIMK